MTYSIQWVPKYQRVRCIEWTSFNGEGIQIQTHSLHDPVDISCLSAEEKNYVKKQLSSDNSWWRHQMETFSSLLALCEGNLPATGGSPHKG